MAQKGLKLSSSTLKSLLTRFTMKIDVLSYVLDHPGVGKVFNLMGSGAKGFKWCEIKDKCHLE